MIILVGAGVGKNTLAKNFVDVLPCYYFASSFVRPVKEACDSLGLGETEAQEFLNKLALHSFNRSLAQSTITTYSIIDTMVYTKKLLPDAVIDRSLLLDNMYRIKICYLPTADQATEAQKEMDAHFRDFLKDIEHITLLGDPERMLKQMLRIL